MQHVLRTAERRLGIHHPVLTEQRAKERAEDRLLREGLKSAGEAQLSLLESSLQRGGELAAKDASEHLHWQEERLAWAILLDEAFARHTDDIGHLEGWLIHLLCSLRERFTCSGPDSSSLSSGVPAAFR